MSRGPISQRKEENVSTAARANLATAILLNGHQQVQTMHNQFSTTPIMQNTTATIAQRQPQQYYRFRQAGINPVAQPLVIQSGSGVVQTPKVEQNYVYSAMVFPKPAHSEAKSTHCVDCRCPRTDIVITAIPPPAQIPAPIRPAPVVRPLPPAAPCSHHCEADLALRTARHAEQLACQNASGIGSVLNTISTVRSDAKSAVDITTSINNNLNSCTGQIAHLRTEIDRALSIGQQAGSAAQRGCSLATALRSDLDQFAGDCKSTRTLAQSAHNLAESNVPPTQQALANSERAQTSVASLRAQFEELSRKSQQVATDAASVREIALRAERSATEGLSTSQKALTSAETCRTDVATLQKASELGAAEVAAARAESARASRLAGDAMEMARAAQEAARAGNGLTQELRQIAETNRAELLAVKLSAEQNAAATAAAITESQDAKRLAQQSGEEAAMAKSQSDECKSMLEQVRKQLEAAQQELSTVAAVSAKNGALSNSIDDLSKKVDGLTKRLGSSEKEVSQIGGDLSSWKQQLYDVIGCINSVMGRGRSGVAATA